MGEEEGRGVGRVADGYVTIGVKNMVVVEDMVCGDEVIEYFFF